MLQRRNAQVLDSINGIREVVDWRGTVGSALARARDDGARCRSGGAACERRLRPVGPCPRLRGSETVPRDDPSASGRKVRSMRGLRVRKLRTRLGQSPDMPD